MFYNTTIRSHLFEQRSIKKLTYAIFSWKTIPKLFKSILSPIHLGGLIFKYEFSY